MPYLAKMRWTLPTTIRTSFYYPQPYSSKPDVALADKIALSSPSNPLVSAALHALDDGKSLLARASKHNWHYKDGKLYFKN